MLVPGLETANEVSGRNQNWSDEIRFVTLSLPLAALAIQLPLWLLKLYFGWCGKERRMRRCTGRPPIGYQRLFIGDHFGCSFNHTGSPRPGVDAE